MLQEWLSDPDKKPHEPPVSRNWGVREKGGGWGSQVSWEAREILWGCNTLQDKEKKRWYSYIVTEMYQLVWLVWCWCNVSGCGDWGWCSVMVVTQTHQHITSCHGMDRQAITPEGDINYTKLEKNMQIIWSARYRTDFKVKYFFLKSFVYIPHCSSGTIWSHVTLFQL